MSDDSSTTGRSAGAALVALALAAVLLAAGAAVLSGTVPDVDTGGAADDAEPELAGLQTQDPRCGTHRSDNSSTYSRPVDGGYQIGINETLPVAARDSTLDADLREVGPNRYRLDLRRVAGERRTDCFLEMRFDATVNLTQGDDYTLVVTVDRTYHSMLYADPGHSGATSSNRDLRPPAMNDSEWRAALNASDAHFENETGTHVSGSDGSGGGSGSASAD